MTEKLTAWLFLVSLLVLTLSTASHRRWSIDARPILVAVQHVDHTPAAVELFYVDEDGNKQDAALHEEILRHGDHAAAKAISDEIKKRIFREAGIDPNQPRAVSEADFAALTALGVGKNRR